MESVISAAEGVKKRTRSSSRTSTTASASKKSKTAPGPFSPAQSSQPLAPRTSRSRAPASASVFGQAPYEGEPPADHVTSPFSLSTRSQPILTSSQEASAQEPTASLSQVSTQSAPALLPLRTTWTTEEGDDSVSERSLSPPHIPATRLDIPATRLDIPADQFEDFKRIMFEGQQRAAARQESDSHRIYAMQQQFSEQFACLEQRLTQQVLSHCQSMDPNPRTAALHTRQLSQPLPAPTVVPVSQETADPGPQWEYTEPDYSDDWQESDGEEPLEVAPSDAPTKGEVQTVLEILRDALGISVAVTEPKPPAEKTRFSIFAKGKLAAEQPQPLAFPIDPGVADRATDISIKKSRPSGAELHILQDEQAAVVSNTPIPEDVWDRLLLNNKARISGGTGSTTQEKRVCRLSDKKDAEAESDLSWFGDAAVHGIEASALTLYIGEWLSRVEDGSVVTTQQVRTFMIAIQTKFQRRALDQFFKISQQSTNLRRNLILPLCGIPEVAKARFKALTLVGHDLFAGSFQDLVTSEAARRDSYKKTTDSFQKTSCDLEKDQVPAQPFRDTPRRGRHGGRSGNSRRQRPQQSYVPYSQQQQQQPQQSQQQSNSQGRRDYSKPYKPYTSKPRRGRGRRGGRKRD